jgi:hypothetical protein
MNDKSLVGWGGVAGGATFGTLSAFRIMMLSHPAILLLVIYGIACGLAYISVRASIISYLQRY